MSNLKDEMRSICDILETTEKVKGENFGVACNLLLNITSLSTIAQNTLGDDACAVFDAILDQVAGSSVFFARKVLGDADMTEVTKTVTSIVNRAHSIKGVS